MYWPIFLSTSAYAWEMICMSEQTWGEKVLLTNRRWQLWKWTNILDGHHNLSKYGAFIEKKYLYSMKISAIRFESFMCNMCALLTQQWRFWPLEYLYTLMYTLCMEGSTSFSTPNLIQNGSATRKIFHWFIQAIFVSLHCAWHENIITKIRIAFQVFIILSIEMSLSSTHQQGHVLRMLFHHIPILEYAWVSLNPHIFILLTKILKGESQESNFSLSAAEPAVAVPYRQTPIKQYLFNYRVIVHNYTETLTYP